MLTRSFPGQTQTRTALPLLGPGESEKMAMGWGEGGDEGSVWLRVGGVNVGSMKVMSGVVDDMAKRRRLDFVV